MTFLEYWKRKNASLAHHWDCMGFKEEEERPRPEFAAKAPFLEKNPITGIKEPHFPDNLRLKRVVVGAGLICFMVRIVSDHKIFPFEVKLSLIHNTETESNLYLKWHVNKMTAVIAVGKCAILKVQ